MIYDHQDEIKELVDKITELETSKMDLLKKYELECMKSIKNLHGSDMNNIEMQNLKERLDKKNKDFDDSQKKYKDLLANL